MSLVAKFFLLSSSKRMVILQALLLLIAVRISLWLLPFRVVYTFLERMARQSSNLDSADAQVEMRLTWAVKTISPYVPQASCLTQALVLWVLLGRAAVRSEVRIGVAKNGQGQLEAHAWVVRQNRVLIGDLPDLTRYTLLPSLERALL